MKFSFVYSTNKTITTVSGRIVYHSIPNIINVTR